MWCAWRTRAFRSLCAASGLRRACDDTRDLYTMLKLHEAKPLSISNRLDQPSTTQHFLPCFCHLLPLPGSFDLTNASAKLYVASLNGRGTLSTHAIPISLWVKHDPRPTVLHQSTSSTTIHSSTYL